MKNRSLDTLMIKPYLTILQFSDTTHIGTLPPRALVVEQSPSYLADLLRYLSEPRTPSDIIDFAQSKLGISAAECLDIMNSLREYEIVGRPISDETRYARHSLYYDLIGAEADEVQSRIENSRVCLLGVGGIGAAIASILAGAGIGTIALVDGDHIELTNLTRQYLFRESDIGRPKVDRIAEAISEANSTIRVEPHMIQISNYNEARSILDSYDFVVLSGDRPSLIHKWVNDAAISRRFTYSSAGYIDAYGAVGPIVAPGKTPCYECREEEINLFGVSHDRASDLKNLNPVHQAASFGPLNALVAALQANEVLRYLGGLECRTLAKRLLIESWTYNIHEEAFSASQACGACATADVTWPSGA